MHKFIRQGCSGADPNGPALGVSYKQREAGDRRKKWGGVCEGSLKRGIWEAAIWTAGLPLLTVNSRKLPHWCRVRWNYLLAGHLLLSVPFCEFVDRWRQNKKASKARNELSPFAPNKLPCILEWVQSLSPYSLSVIIFQLEVSQELVFSLHAGHGFTSESMQEDCSGQPCMLLLL